MAHSTPSKVRVLRHCATCATPLRGGKVVVEQTDPAWNAPAQARVASARKSRNSPLNQQSRVEVGNRPIVISTAKPRLPRRRRPSLSTATITRSAARVTRAFAAIGCANTAAHSTTHQRACWRVLGPTLGPSCASAPIEACQINTLTTSDDGVAPVCTFGASLRKGFTREATDGDPGETEMVDACD